MAYDQNSTFVYHSACVVGRPLQQRRPNACRDPGQQRPLQPGSAAGSASLQHVCSPGECEETEHRINPSFEITGEIVGICFPYPVVFVVSVSKWEKKWCFALCMSFVLFLGQLTQDLFCSARAAGSPRCSSSGTWGSRMRS